MNIKEFKKLPILGILRGVELAAMEALVEAVVSSGLKTIEITMNTEGASELIRKAVKASNGRLTIGAGTVLDARTLKTALDSGATFIVMPTLIDDVMRACVKDRIPVFPGALTPTEIYKAWRLGATMVKVFPSNFFGPAYFKEIKAPFDDIELLACGGVTPENIGSYFANGTSAVAFGASIFKKELIVRKDFAAISSAITKLIAAIPSSSRSH